MIWSCSWRRCRALFQSAHPCWLLHRFWGREWKQIIWSRRSHPAQFRCQLEFLSCFLFCWFRFIIFFAPMLMIKAARLASNFACFRVAEVWWFRDRKVCVFGVYVFLISDVFSPHRIEIASVLILLQGLGALLGKVCRLVCNSLAWGIDWILHSVWKLMFSVMNLLEIL